MHKEVEQQLVASVRYLISQALEDHGRANYGGDGALDFLEKWSDAIAQDLPMDCACDRLAAAKMEAEHITTKATATAERVTKNAQEQANAAHSAATRTVQTAASHLRTALEALKRYG
jgi:cell division septum initiation protein DivIVA